MIRGADIVDSVHQQDVPGGVAPASRARIEVISPSTEELLTSVPEGSKAAVGPAVAFRRAFDRGPWPRVTAAEQGATCAASARRSRPAARRWRPRSPRRSRLRRRSPQLAQLLRDVETGGRRVPLYEHAAFEERRFSPGGEALIVNEPVGVVATIIPWNGPVGSASLVLSPALAAGRTMVLKPAPEGPVGLFLLAEAIEAAGLSERVVSIVPAGPEVDGYLVRRRIMSLCEKRITRANLELGGESAGIVCDDTPPEQVLRTLLPDGYGHSGQVCATTNRLLVSRNRHDEFVKAAASVLASLSVGDPREPATVIGPLAAERQRDRVESYIAVGKDEGARVAIGGRRPKGLDRGWFVESTLFANTTYAVRIAREEIFGPVLTVIPYDTVDEAVAIANDSQYELSGSVYTLDKKLGESVARRIRTGQMFVNDDSMCVTPPSGFGREGGVEGIAHYFERKVIQGI